MGNAGWMATTRDLAEDARRVAVQTQALYLSLGESQEHQSQPRTSIPESAGHDRPHPAPKSESVMRRLRTKTSSLFSSAAPTIAFLGTQGVGKRTRGCKRHFRLVWQPPDLYQGPAGPAGAGWVWKELSQVADPSFFLYLQR